MTQLTIEQSAQLHHLLATGQKLAAIKLYRDWTGADLAAAKTHVEQIPIDVVTLQPQQRSLLAWTMFVAVLLILVILPGYMVYNAFFKEPPKVPVGTLPPDMAVDQPTTRRARPTTRGAMTRRPTTTRAGTTRPATLADAIMRADYATASDMLDRGYNVNVLSTDGQRYTPLIAAAGHPADSQFALVQRLVEKGARVNDKAASGYTALMRAVRFRSPKTVDYLIAHGADVNVVSRRGETALDIARQVQQPAIEQPLLKAGAKAGADFSVEAPTTKP